MAPAMAATVAPVASMTTHAARANTMTCVAVTGNPVHMSAVALIATGITADIVTTSTPIGFDADMAFDFEIEFNAGDFRTATATMSESM